MRAVADGGLGAMDAPRLSISDVAVSCVDDAEQLVDTMVLRFAPDALDRYMRLQAAEGAIARGHGFEFGRGDYAVTLARNFAMPDAPSFMALSADAVRECLSDASRFDGKVYDDFGAADRDPSQTGLPLMDGPPHTRLRRLLALGLNPRSISLWEDLMVRPVVDALLQACPRNVPVDFARAFCRPLPGSAIGAVLGLHPDDLNRFNLLAFLSFVGPIHPEGGKAQGVLAGYFHQQITHRRSLDPDDLAARQDIISLLVKARIGDDALTDAEIIPNLFFLLFAGSDTTYLSLCNLVYQLIEVPGLWEQAKRDRALIAPLIEETLRLNPPGPVIARRAKQATRIHDVDVPAGAIVALNLLTANRDADLWPDPHAFRIDRGSAAAHLSFGYGPHTCPGMHLSRLEMRTALNRLLDSTRKIEWSPEHGRPDIVGIGSRAIAHTQIILR